MYVKRRRSHIHLRDGMAIQLQSQQEETGGVVYMRHKKEKRKQVTMMRRGDTRVDRGYGMGLEDRESTRLKGVEGKPDGCGSVRLHAGGNPSRSLRVGGLH